MSTLAVAKKDFQDAIRSRTLLVVAGLFTAVMAVLTYVIFALYAPDMSAEAADLFLPVGSLVPVLGTLLGYKAIVGERESGSLQFLLGLPHTRRDVILGKLIGRAGVVAVTVLVGFAVVVAHFAVLADSPALGAYVLVTGKLVVLGVVFVAIAIAFSAAARSLTVATWGAVGLAILFAFLWESLLLVVRSSVFEGRQPPDWFFLLKRLNPKYVFMDASALGAGSGAAPFYLAPWFGAVILGAWVVVPLGLAVLRFERGDLV